MTDLILTPPLVALIAAVGGYLLGSIPFGVLTTSLAGLNIREVGSGNIGATNVLRTGRKDLALITLVGDSGKGALAVLLAYLLLGQQPESTRQMGMALAGAAAFLGHCFPVWLKFNGGKGVATFFGTLIAASWPVGLAAGAVWLLVAFVLRISSLSALVAAAMAAPLALLLDQPHAFAVMALFMALLIYVRHAENIKRLLSGTEPRIGQKKTQAAEAEGSTPPPSSDEPA